MDDLPMCYQRTLAVMPDLAFGEDRSDYIRRCIAWAEEQCVPRIEAMHCARIKWDRWEVERLIVEIEEGSSAALQRGVIRLLKRAYHL